MQRGMSEVYDMANETQKTTLVDTIYSNIRKDITQRILKPGQKINVKELTERYGVSQTPVKLALSRLISENIIENFPRQGMQVRLVQVEDIEEIFDTRLMLDLYYTKEIITTVNYNENLRIQLERNVEEHLKVITAPDYLEYPEAYLKNYEYDAQFHELYLKCTGSKLIVDIFRYINPYLYTNYIYRKQSREKDISGVREHEAILNAIKSEDEAALKEAVTIHQQNAKRAVGLILRVNKMI